MSNLARAYRVGIADLEKLFAGLELVFVAGGDKIPRKGGPGVSRSDQLCSEGKTQA